MSNDFLFIMSSGRALSGSDGLVVCRSGETFYIECHLKLGVLHV